MSSSGTAPPIAAVARDLATSLPESERATGEALLRDEILPWDLRNYAGHPKPDRLLAIVVDELRQALTAAAPEARAAVLSSRATRGRIQRTLAAAHDLALRRWSLDHRESPAAQARITDPSIVGLSRDEVAARSGALLDQLTALEAATRQAQTFERDRLDLLHARVAAGSARSGDFSMAVGRLADDLRALGERPRDPNPH